MARSTGPIRGRPKIDPEVERLMAQMARENSGWGYDRIAGALANLGHSVSDQTVGNVLRRHGIAPPPKRSQTTAWKDFIAAHMAVLSGMDFFTAEVLTWRGPATYYVLFLIHLETRRVTLAGMTQHPTEEWLQQVARNLTDAQAGALRGQRYLLHDRDTKFCDRFRSLLRSGGVEPLRLPCELSESECICGTVGPFSERRMPVEAHPVRGGIAATSTERVRRVLPQRAKPSGKGKCPALSRAG